MRLIRLTRPAPLTIKEALALPPGVTASEPGTDERATLPADALTSDLLQLVYSLGSAIPGGTLTLDPAPAAPDALPELEAGADPWALADAGDPRAEQLFTGQPLDSAGRSRVQAMLAAPEAATVAMACRIARWTDWKSGVQLIRRLVTHPNAAVRRDAVIAIGELAGPSLTMTIRPLRTDPDPEVRAAALVVLKRFGD